MVYNPESSFSEDPNYFVAGTDYIARICYALIVCQCDTRGLPPGELPGFALEEVVKG